MWIKKYAMPIFLLYIITSSVFLIFFSLIYFQTAKNHIVQEISASLIEQMSEIKSQLNASSSITRDLFINLDDGVKINIYDIKSQIFVIDEFIQPIGGTIIRKRTHFSRKYIDNKIVLKDGAIYLFDLFKYKEQSKIRQQKGSLQVYKITLKDSTYSSEIRIIAIKIITIAICIFLLFILISYFIIRLSFRPLVEKVNSLNSFITDATHEINTPLSVILMSVEMFENNPKKYLLNIKTASKTLSLLYDDLVNLNLKSEPNIIASIDIKSKIKERILYFNVMVQDKNLTINQNLEELFLETDLFKFEKIFDNILSNAIKYSDKNSQISVILNQKSLLIKNIGKTIEKENLDKIYNKFSRFDKQNGGFGIGLSIVKKYCEELGFVIECKSEDKITEFLIKF